MTNTMPFGIRFTSDACGPRSVFTKESVELANRALEGTGRHFYFDQEDWPSQVIDGLHLHDMYGWIVPEEMVDEFKPLWLANADKDMDQYEYATVEFRDGGDGKPVVSFDSEE